MLMMVPNSRLFHKLFIVVLLLEGCGSPIVQPTPHKCQAVVVLDKTNSVGYTEKLPRLQQELARNLEKTYSTGTRNIQCARLVITGKTNVFPCFKYFGKDCPNTELNCRSCEEAWQEWNMEKRKWISDEVKQTISLIESPCNSNTTDIFSIFNGIEEVQKNNGPWDSVNVFIFSDMTNTCRPINMLSEININDAHDKGIRICQQLMDQGQILAKNTENLYLTIYTPDNMDKSAQINQFWKGFFEQWGLKETHYHFE